MAFRILSDAATRLHLPFTVQAAGRETSTDADTCARVPEFGGEVLTHTDIGAAIFIRDPDGQLIELLPMSYRAQFADPG